MRRLAFSLLIIVLGMPALATVIRIPPGVTVEATGPDGATVAYSAVTAPEGEEGEIDENGRPLAKCSPASGSKFPLGTTTVTCTHVADGQTTTASFDVNVVDTTPPHLELDSTHTVKATSSNGAVVSYTTFAHDIVDGNRPVSCAPASGSLFPVGRSAVNCSASDTRGNTASGSFDVVVEPAATPPPSLNLPDDMTVEATGPSGAVVTYQATSSGGDNDDENGRPTTTANCAPASGSTFPLGTTTVQCTVTDSGGTTTGSFNVTVVDTTAPTLVVPRDMTVEAPSADGIAVSFDATATDLVSGSVSATCSPASGSVFPVGNTAVTCTATDAAGNTATEGFTVTVTTPNTPPPPALNLPDDITAEAEGPGGAVVTFTVTTSNGGSNGGDDENGRPTGSSVTCAPASGSLFPVGTTTVTCTSGALSGSFLVHVVDTAAPELSLPGDIVSTDPVVNYTATASDLVDGSVAVTCSPASGSTFAAGTTAVNCSASDANGNTATGSFNVTVQQTTAREITVTATPDQIWPPDKKFVSVTVTVATSDNSAFTASIASVASNENDPEDRTTPDWVITGPLTVDLRAEKGEQASERIYTITVSVTDADNVTHQKTVNVSVKNAEEDTASELTLTKTRGSKPSRRKS